MTIRPYMNSVPKIIQTKKPSRGEKVLSIRVEIIIRDRRNSNQ